MAKLEVVAPTGPEVKMAPLPMGAIKNTCDKMYCFELIRILMEEHEVSVFEMKSQFHKFHLFFSPLT